MATANGTCLLHNQEPGIVALLVRPTGFCGDVVEDSKCGTVMFYQQFPRSAKHARGVGVDLNCRL